MSRISLHQFMREKEWKGDQLVWPGVNGLPFTGRPNAEGRIQVPQLQGDQADNLPVKIKFDSGMFETWDETQKVAYDNVCNHIASGVWMQKNRAERWVEKGLQIWLEWYILALELPETKHGIFPR